MSDSLEDLAEGIVYAESVLHSHRPVNPGPGRTRCPVCDAWYPCDLISLAALAALKQGEAVAAQATIAQRDAQVAELTAALQAVMRRIDRTGKACWCPPIFDDRTFHTSDCLRAKELMARTPAAPQDSHNP